MCIPFISVFKDNFKRGKVTGINPANKSVTMETGESISYDYLVIATGSGGPHPFKMETSGRELVTECERLRKEVFH